jgi:hypothetical protein
MLDIEGLKRIGSYLYPCAGRIGYQKQPPVVLANGNYVKVVDRTPELTGRPDITDIDKSRG